MDLYNNYYEELYHAGLFSALRGRIRDGHKWVTRTGTPGHYVYTYAKDLAGKARSMFGKPRGMFGTRKTTSTSKSTSNPVAGFAGRSDNLPTNSSSSSSNRPRRREKNVTNTQATAVSPKKGESLGYDFVDKRRANPIKTDANNHLLPGNNPYARLGNSVRVPGAQRKKRRQSSGALRSR